MKTIAMLLLVAVAVMYCSGELHENPEEPLGLFKRHINCPPGALCQPATKPPFIDAAGHRQKRGSKPVPIIACNRKTGKCTRI